MRRMTLGILTLGTLLVIGAVAAPLLATLPPGPTPILPTETEVWGTVAKKKVLKAISWCMTAIINHEMRLNADEAQLADSNLKLRDVTNKATDQQARLDRLDNRVAFYACHGLWSSPVQQTFGVYGIQDAYIVSLRPDTGFLMPDPANNQVAKHDDMGLEILTDEQTFKAAISNAVPSAFMGPAALDQEGALENTATLVMDQPTPTVLEARARMATMIRWANEARPNAEWGFYGLPYRTVYGGDGGLVLAKVRESDQQAAAITLGFGVEAFFPSLYDTVYGEPWALGWEDSINRACLEVQLVAAGARNVYAYVAKRYHPNGRWDSGLGFCIVDPQEAAATLYAIRDTAVNGKRAGAIAWGNESYYMKVLGQWQGLPLGDRVDETYRMMSVLSAERLKDQTTDSYIDQTDSFFMLLCAHVLRDYPLVSSYRANLGPVITVVPAIGPAIQPPVKILPITPVAAELVPAGPLNVTGNITIENRAITADKPYLPAGSQYFSGGQGITCSQNDRNKNGAIDDDEAVRLVVRNSAVFSYRYGIWVDAASVLLDHVAIEARPSGLGDGDDYAVRGATSKWRSNDCSFTSHNKACFRLYNCVDFESQNDSFSGSRLMLGGGSANEWTAAGAFKGKLISAKITCQSVQVYSASDVTFQSCDFTNTIELHVEGKATLDHCVHVPLITKGSTAIVAVLP